MFKLFGRNQKDDSSASTPSVSEMAQQQQQQQDSITPDSPMTVSSMLGGVDATAALAKLHKLPQIPGLEIHTDNDKDIDYFFVDDLPLVPGQQTVHAAGSFGPLPMRTNSDKMLYGTGAAYVCGLSTGGTYGFWRGLRSKYVQELIRDGGSWKLRLNAVVNSVTRFGPNWGNSWGMLTFVYAAIDSTLPHLPIFAQEAPALPATTTLPNGMPMPKPEVKSDYRHHLLAAFTTGALFKSVAGVRPALTMGTLLASLVGAYGAYQNREDLMAKVRGGIKRENNIPAAV